MGYSCTEIPEPRVKTRLPVVDLHGSTIWLISGEGDRSKSYFLASTFVVEQCHSNRYPGMSLPNQVSGQGKLFGITIRLDGTPLLELIRRETANFVSGLREIRNPKVISELRVLV
jgi:hypothetical protein